jgi:vacuolar-type H+-ATPase subunit I/STV1
MKTLKRNTYTYQVMKWLESGKSITSKQAIDSLGCTRLSAVIFNLINIHEMPITKDMVPVKNRNGRWVEVAKYYLSKTAS